MERLLLRAASFFDCMQLNLHCSLVYAQFIPLLVLAILIFTLLEAAGNASANDPWPQVDDQQAAQLTSAKIMQRTGILIMPMVLASFICGTVSEYDQNVYMYGIFTALNGVLGGMILVMHSSANEKIRNYLGQTWKQLVKKD